VDDRPIAARQTVWTHPPRHSDGAIAALTAYGVWHIPSGHEPSLAL
jgi:hypothetical protein